LPVCFFSLWNRLVGPGRSGAMIPGKYQN
jgi:hypothetical protein